MRLRNVYLVGWKTGDAVSVSVFTNNELANVYFNKLVSKFNLTEQKCLTYYMRQAHGNGKATTATGEGSLILTKQLLNEEMI